MYYFSILIVIIASVFYTIFQDIIPDTVNPLIALCCMYSAGAVLALIFYFKTREKGQKHKLKSSVEWRVIAFGLTNIIIDAGFLLAFRSGWQVSFLSIMSNIIILIILTVVGLVFFKEKLSFLNIVGIVVGTFGLSVLGF